MATVTLPTPEWTAADIVAHFGPIPLRRLRLEPAPGSATEEDVIDINDRENRLYELVDGVLVEKTMGVQESFLAMFIGRLLGDFADRHNLGFVLGADGMARLAPGLVRIPDVSFVSWQQVPSKQIPKAPMLRLAPDLAVEVLSPSNTRQEMDQKLHDYFTAGVRLVWYVDPEQYQVQVFTGVDQCTTLQAGQTLVGDPVLPGFLLPLDQLFAGLEK